MDLQGMKMGELRELATEMGVDLKGRRKKDDIIAAIEAGQANEPMPVEAEIIDEDAGSTGELAVSFSPGVLSANFSALDSHVDAILDEYRDWEPSADSQEDVKQCATHRKYLNGLAKQIDERRKAVKNEYMRPLTCFEGECNRIRDKIKDVSARLNDVEKEADEARKAQKQAELQEHYEAYAGLLAEVVPYERIADPKWLNKAPTLEKAKTELEERIDRVASDWETLKRLNLEFFEQAEIQFFNTLDLGQATAYADKLAEDARKIEGMKAEMEQYAPADDEVPVDVCEGSHVACAADERPAPHPVDEDGYEPFDPMTMEQEHRAYNPLNAYKPPTPEPRQCDPNVTVESLIDRAIELSGGMVKDVFKAAVNRISTPFGGDGASAPCVAAFDSATPRQMDLIGKCAGAVGATTRFYHGSMQEAYQAWCLEQARKQEGRTHYV